MRIKSIHIKNFKRFTDLTLQNIPQSAKLVVLVGPNGCGKTSVFEAFNQWYRLNGWGWTGDPLYIEKRDLSEGTEINRSYDFYQNIKIDFYDLDQTTNQNLAV